MIDLRNLFHGLQEQMLTSLNVNRMFIGHPGSKGDATEQHWIEFLRAYLPERYKVDKAIVIDSTGNVSEQMDVVIYDAPPSYSNRMVSCIYLRKAYMLCLR